MLITANKRDVVWNYIGTIVSMASGFVLLPLLVYYLTDEELGLWYVYISIANLAMLFEFGFNPTFARNIVYVLSGSHSLKYVGKGPINSDQINWHLLNTVIASSRFIYALIATVVLILLCTFGTYYVNFISVGLNDEILYPSWIIFIIAIFFNLYFLYSITQIRGYGDVAGENKAKTVSKIFQLFVTAILLVNGAGLIGASIGFLTNSLMLRVLSFKYIRCHKSIERHRKEDCRPVKISDVVDVVKQVGGLVWRDGVVQLALYGSTQSMSIMSSIYLGLAETGTYSISLQLATAIYNFAAAYPKAFFPAMQASYAEGNLARQRSIVSSGIVAFWASTALGSICVIIFIIPMLSFIKPESSVESSLLIMMIIYMALLQQHSIFCSYIISTNEIPYMKGYLTACLLGIFFVFLLCSRFHLGSWGIILGQFLSQLIYNNWKWPKYFCNKLGLTYFQAILMGCNYWKSKLLGNKD